MVNRCDILIFTNRATTAVIISVCLGDSTIANSTSIYMARSSSTFLAHIRWSTVILRLRNAFCFCPAAYTSVSPNSLGSTSGGRCNFTFTPVVGIFIPSKVTVGYGAGVPMLVIFPTPFSNRFMVTLSSMPFGRLRRISYVPIALTSPVAILVVASTITGVLRGFLIFRRRICLQLLRIRCHCRWHHGADHGKDQEQ